MGSPFNIILYAPDSLSASQAATASFRLVDSLAFIFSDYIDSSELNRLCATAGKPNSRFIASPALFDILLQSRYAFEKSKGSFDITLGPVTRLWRKARKDKVWPSKEAVKEKLALTGFNKIKLDESGHAVYLQQQGMQLDLGGIAQGYIAQKVIELLREKNIQHALVDVSGDIAAIGAPPGSAGWTVAVNIPGESERLLPKYLLISNQAVTTSGDVYQFMMHEGKKYSHVIDPRTGYGITSRKNVTVISIDCTMADWLTKACSLLPVKKAKKLANQLGAKVLIAEMKNKRLVLHSSSHFSDYWKPVIE
jgi:thiamine biosynthesis lipoprotein